MNKKIAKCLVFIFCIFNFVFLAAYTYATTDLLMSTLSVKVAKGEEFFLDVFIDPRGDKNYTTVLELKFQPDYIEVVSFDFDEGWMSLPQPGYDTINNDVGFVIKTAGFPGGTDKKKKFGTIKFKSKKAGTSLIRVGDNSMAIGANNSDTFSRAFPTVVVLSGEAAGEMPSQLFDINLELDTTKATDMSEMIFRVLFISFGSVPTPVDLTFTVLNEEGQEVHTEKDYVVVETEQVLEKKLTDLNLPIGDYKLVLKTLYNQDVSDKFEQDFKIVDEVTEIKFYNTIWFWLLVILPVAILAISAVRDKRKKK